MSKKRAAGRSRAVDYGELMKKVESVVAELKIGDNVATTIRAVANRSIDLFHSELGLTGGRLYRRHGEFYEIEATFPDAKEVPAGLRVPITYGPVDALLARGLIYMDRTDPGIDTDFENRLGVERFAAIEVGESEYLLSFDVEPGYEETDILFSLSILRHSIDQKLRRERIEGVFQEARRIQQSILPRRAPEFGRFDIAARSVPLEIVGGDYFDFIPVTAKILGIGIADVSGHGLPAALQVRDIHMGLRMGLSRDFKIVRTVERLNQIIHGSTLTSRFVSMFYGELELSGMFIYVNAGHPAPFHLSRNGGVRFLEEGGAVLGPIEDATYERGFALLEPGDTIVFYTDGIVETLEHGKEGPDEEFGVDRLVEIVRSNFELSAEDQVAAVYDEIAGFSGTSPQPDDRTLVVLRWPAD